MTELHVVLGGAGFIGSNLSNRLLHQGNVVIAIDNLANHHSSFAFLDSSPSLLRFNCDLSQSSAALDAYELISQAGIPNNLTSVNIWHLAANSDIQSGILSPTLDLNNTFLTTMQACELSKLLKADKLMFASSSAVLGDKGGKPTKESNESCLPISNYGAMKLASEAYLSSFAHTTSIPTYVFRFPNVTGIPATHGVIFDFVTRLIDSPDTLFVKGNGHQEKPYLLVSDLIDAMQHIISSSLQPISKSLHICNIAPSDCITIREIAEIVVDTMQLNSEIRYEDAAYGWVGDVPKYSLDTSLLVSTGFTKELTSIEAVKTAALQILNILR